MKQAFVIVVCCLLAKCEEPEPSGDLVYTCRTPDSGTGYCISIQKCDVFINALATANEEEKKFMRDSVCGWEGPRNPKVCCGCSTFYKPVLRGPDVQRRRDLLPNRTRCGYEEENPNKILGGTNAKIYSFPWSALLKYVEGDEEPKFKCGGALINERYVLTAAHCIDEGLKWIRLGELDLKQSPYCTSKKINGICNSPFEVEVESTVTHPEYQTPSYRHDIALIRLKYSVTFSEFVRPICLPLDASERSQPGDMLWMAGWGRTNESSLEQSSIKQIAQFPIVSLDTCRKIFKEKRFFPTLGKWSICAGGTNNKSTCNGDSGGALAANTTEHMQYYVEGVLSVGQMAKCAEDIPVVFTRVSNYLDWIKKNVRP